MKNPSYFLFVLIAAATSLAVPSFADDGGAWASRPIWQDVYVKDAAPNSNFRTDNYLGAGNNRESVMMLDVSGLAQVTSARIRFYILQCGTKEGISYPLYFRVMRNDQWNESTATWNGLPDEFRVSSPILATDDPTLAGYLEIPAGATGTWQEVDITQAVKAAAPRGRLALHVYTYWDGLCGDTTPLALAASNHENAQWRPVLEFQGPADPSASSLTLIPTDDAFIESSHNSINYGVPNAGNNYDRYMHILIARNNREGFLKFDLSGIGTDPVDSAILLLRMNDTQANHTAGNEVQFQLMANTSWRESEVTWNNSVSTTGVAPASGWPEECPKNAVRVNSAGTNIFYSVELAPLVNQVLAAGQTVMSLHIKLRSATPTYFLFYSKECENERYRPRLLVTPKTEASLITRTPVQETTLSGYSTTSMDTPCYDGDLANQIQIGCSAKNQVLYGVMLFDPSKLEDASCVRLRVRGVKKGFPAGSGNLRITAALTDLWNETNLTWNTALPWFPQPARVAADTVLDGEIANFHLTQTKDYPFFEADVTETVRAAAQAGRMVSFGFFSNSQTWLNLYKGASDAPAVLIFPDPDATFGNKVSCSLGEQDGKPALRLSWSPSSSADARYTVERQQEDHWQVVATGLTASECLDSRAQPNTAQTYRITETTTGERVVRSVTLVPSVKVFACADTFVQNGSYANTAFGKNTMIVHKYDRNENNGGVREGFYRFKLADMPDSFASASFKLYPVVTDGDCKDARIDLLSYPDFEWTDDAAPTWSDVFENGWATPVARADGSDAKRAAETFVDSYVCNDSGDLQTDVPISFNVTAAVRAAKAAGQTHITLHSVVAGGNNWNFGLIPRDRSQGVSCAPQIVFTLRDWTDRGMVILMR